jgi:nitrate/nitrite-specific signal transduction histidine kinase
MLKKDKYVFLEVYRLMVLKSIQKQQFLHSVMSYINLSLFTNNKDPSLTTSKNPDTESLAFTFRLAYRHWFDVVRPQLITNTLTSDSLFNLLSKQVLLIDSLVNRFQLEAESKIPRLRTFQLIAMLITTLVGRLF